MKTKLVSILFTFLLCSTVYLPISSAQDYTTWGLPEGATKRLGKGTIYEIAYSPDGTRLAVASSIGIWLYDAQTGEELNLFAEQQDSVRSVSFSPDGQTLASGSSGWDGTIRLWDVSTGDTIRTLTGHTGFVYSVSFSPDGQTLASGSSGWDGTIRLWDVSTGDTIRTLTGHTDDVSSVSFSPDGQTLASGETLASGGDLDGTIRLWDVSTGDHLRTLTGHTLWVYSVSFSPDGQTLASGSGDKTIRLWDVSTGDTIRTLTGHTGYVRSVSFSPDGQTLASTGLDGTVLLWNAPTETESIRITADVNGDGEVNILDLVAVAAAFGETAGTPADVNGDGEVNILDLVAVAAAFGEGVANAPAAIRLSQLSPETVQHWLAQAQARNLTDANSQRGIRFLEQLLVSLTPKETALLPNYPNPFNPETWIPYQLADPAEVTLRIHAVDGNLVRTLSLGHKEVGIYQTRTRAAYWDGKNEVGERVASGVYFYTLMAGDFQATRKMLIRK